MIDEIVLKRCNKCGEPKGLGAFTPLRTGKHGVHGTCKKCRATRLLKRYHEDKEPQRKAARRYYYGMTHERFAQMVEEQGGVCAICKREPKSFLYVDHDHLTNEVRGLLCPACNVGIGNLGDTADGARAALHYLERAEARYPER